VGGAESRYRHRRGSAIAQRGMEPVVTKNSVGIATVEVVAQWNHIPAACENFIFSVLYSLSCGLQTRTPYGPKARSANYIRLETNFVGTSVIKCC
jgi:hypothetical protein